MKKLFVLLILATPFVFQFCSSTKNAAKKTKQPVLLTYQHDIQPIVVANCSPCHFPPKGNKKPLDNYASVKGDIDDIISRISKNPGERGFMPFKHATKLPDSTINAFVQWKKDGLLEK